MKVMDFANRWEEHRGIKRKPGIRYGYSAWERIKKFFIKPEWAPWRKQKKEVEGVTRNINEDSSVIYTKFSGRDDFTPQFAADKLKELGYSTEEIRKLGRVYEGIQ